MFHVFNNNIYADFITASNSSDLTEPKCYKTKHWLVVWQLKQAKTCIWNWVLKTIFYFTLFFEKEHSIAENTKYLWRIHNLFITNKLSLQLEALSNCDNFTVITILCNNDVLTWDYKNNNKYQVAMS